MRRQVKRSAKQNRTGKATKLNEEMKGWIKFKKIKKDGLTRTGHFSRNINMKKYL